jgi:hypothetical protein
MKKFVLVVMLCCSFCAVSNAIWLPAFFVRFVNAGFYCQAYCHECIWGSTMACVFAKEYCTRDECLIAYEKPDVN